MGYLKPSPKKIILFLIFAFILFSALFLPDKIAEGYFILFLARWFIFFPLIILKGILTFILGNGGDFIYTPGYVEVMIYILSVIYSYVWASLLIDPSTRLKWNRIFRIMLAMFMFVIGTLFLIWQFNPNYNPGSHTFEVIESVYGWLIAALVCYSVFVWLIRKTKKVESMP
jgi:hypothetical protein